MKAIRLILSTGISIFTLLSLYMAFDFFLKMKNEQTVICIVLSLVSFFLFNQLNKK